MSLFFFLFLAIFSFEGKTQEEGFWDSVGQDLASPVTTPALGVFALGTAATITTLIFEDQIVDPTQEEVAGEKPLGRWHTLGNYGGKGYLNGAYIFGMMGYSALSGSKVAANRSALMFKTTLYSLAISTALKGIVREPRPNNPQERTSFPSGHSTAAFGFATVVAASHSWYWGLLAYSLAGLTAYSRINDNKHFLHDVIAGATIGASYGLGLYFRGKENGKKYSQKANEDSSFLFAQILPTENLKGLEFNLKASFP